MKKEDIKGICISVLDKLRNVETSEKELGIEFIQLGLQLSEIESCAHIAGVAKRYAYLLSSYYPAENCEWSELVEEIKELRRELYKASISIDVGCFFEAKTNFIMGINRLKSALASTDFENMSATEAIELTDYCGKHIESLRCDMGNWE